SATLRTSLRNSTTAKDAQLLYRKIKDVLSIEDFTQFASVIHAFNSHKLNVDETLSKIKELIPEYVITIQFPSHGFKFSIPYFSILIIIIIIKIQSLKFNLKKLKGKKEKTWINRLDLITDSNLNPFIL
ncbi:hypothetical protein HMI56_000059, partial [Coelomomyces lativittatus]